MENNASAPEQSEDLVSLAERVTKAFSDYLARTADRIDKEIYTAAECLHMDRYALSETQKQQIIDQLTNIQPSIEEKVVAFILKVLGFLGIHPQTLFSWESVSQMSEQVQLAYHQGVFASSQYAA